MITVVVDGASALAKFSPSGIPEAVRRNLRSVLPDLMKRLGREVDNNLSALKSRNRLKLTNEMVENRSGITGQLAVIWTGDPKSSMVPQVLESGAKPHKIEAVNAAALAFDWPVIGGMAFFKSVQHPGFAGIHYMQNAFDSMRAEIASKIGAAVEAGVKE